MRVISNIKTLISRMEESGDKSPHSKHFAPDGPRAKGRGIYAALTPVNRTISEQFDT